MSTSQKEKSTAIAALLVLVVFSLAWNWPESQPALEPAETAVTTEPVPEPTPMTPAEEFRAITAGSTNGFNASGAILNMDADYLFNTIRPSICEAADTTSVTALESVLYDSFRKQGHNTETAQKMAVGMVEATLAHGDCSL